MCFITRIKLDSHENKILLQGNSKVPHSGTSNKHMTF